MELYWPQMAETRVGMAPEGSKTYKSVYYSDVEPSSRAVKPHSRADKAEPAVEQKLKGCEEP